jgi:hypothetical protein
MQTIQTVIEDGVFRVPNAAISRFLAGNISVADPLHRLS